MIDVARVSCDGVRDIIIFELRQSLAHLPFDQMASHSAVINGKDDWKILQNRQMGFSVNGRMKLFPFNVIA